MANRRCASASSFERDRAVPAPLKFERKVEVASLAPHGQVLMRICEQIVEVPSVARNVAVPAPLSLKDIFEMASLVLFKQFFERICYQIVGEPVPQVAEQCFSRLLLCQCPRI